MSNEIEDDGNLQRGSALGRRELMKLGAGVVATALTAQRVSAQGQQPAPAPGSMRRAGEIRPHTGPGYRYNTTRLHNNGPMDDTTRKIVKFVYEFSAANMTPAVTRAINRTMVDSMASLITGFEEEQCRIAARLAAKSPAGDEKCTVLGYGIQTTPELATFANSCMVRATDFNDNAPGGHNSDLIPAALAIGEALHSTGAEVMAAIAVGYEIKAVPAGGEPVAAAMAAGKLMKLDEDRLANAVSIALTPHVALNKGVGAMSMWKGTRSAEATKCGMWAALLAREGMTGPPQPFEGRSALWSRNGRGRDFTLPDQARLGIERNWFKRRPAEASSQGYLLLVPEIKAWTTIDDIEAIQYDTSLGIIEEICDPPKWDPRNRETADHSLPFIVARALIDGDIYMDSFSEAKYMDPVARGLMNRMTFGWVDGWQGLGVGRITIRKKNGETRFWDTYNGARVLGEKEYPNLTDEEINQKYNRACDHMQMAPSQRDQSRTQWWDLKSIRDIAEPIRTLATFGRPRPL